MSESQSPIAAGFDQYCVNTGESHSAELREAYFAGAKQVLHVFCENTTNGKFIKDLAELMEETAVEVETVS